MTENISEFKKWSVNGWSIRQYLLTLKLGLFQLSASTYPKEVRDKCFFAECSFNKPSRIKFHHFTAHNSAFIQDVIVTPAAGGNNHRFVLGKDSFIEIVAPEYSIIKW